MSGTLNQFDASLLNKSINYLYKNNFTDPKPYTYKSIIIYNDI